MKPRLAFVSQWNASLPNVESGYPYSMRRQLQKYFDVVDLFPFALPGERLWLPVRAAYKLSGLYHHPMREPSLLKRLAHRIEAALRIAKPDVVFAPSSIPMTFVETTRPWVYATDQLFCDLLESYVRRPSVRFRRLGEEQESRALRYAARACYPSEWTADRAIRHYGADPSKIAVIPWGANLAHDIADETVTRAIAGRPFDRCNLVFVGRDWSRKGGEVFASTVVELNRLGLPAHGTIIGADPPGLPRAQFTVHPFIDKSTEAGFALFSSLLLESHFLLLPSRAEAYGQAFCEAMAHGVPAIGSTVGGIGTIIRDGQTGFLRSLETAPQAFADLIRNTLASPALYRQLASEARRDYIRRLNWDSFGARLHETVAALV